MLQVLGGVSEEQAAEAPHQKSEDAEDEKEKEVVEEGDGEAAGAEDGVEAMDEDDIEQVTKWLSARSRRCLIMTETRRSKRS